MNFTPNLADFRNISPSTHFHQWYSELVRSKLRTSVGGLSMSKFALRTLLSISFAFMAVTSFAQSGSISGTVKDSSGALVSGAQVTARNLDTNLTRTTVTNGAGVYSIVELPVGNYEITIKKDAFKSFRSAGIALS